MANRKFGKVGNLRNLGKIILSSLFSEFSILPYSQNQKLGFKNLGKFFSRFLTFLRFPSFRPGHEKIQNIIYLFFRFKIYMTNAASEMN